MSRTFAWLAELLVCLHQHQRKRGSDALCRDVTTATTSWGDRNCSVPLSLRDRHHIRHCHWPGYVDPRDKTDFGLSHDFPLKRCISLGNSCTCLTSGFGLKKRRVPWPSCRGWSEDVTNHGLTGERVTHCLAWRGHSGKGTRSLLYRLVFASRHHWKTDIRDEKLVFIHSPDKRAQLM